MSFPDFSNYFETIKFIWVLIRLKIFLDIIIQSERDFSSDGSDVSDVNPRKPKFEKTTNQIAWFQLTRTIRSWKTLPKMHWTPWTRILGNLAPKEINGGWCEPFCTFLACWRWSYATVQSTQERTIAPGMQLDQHYNLLALWSLCS